MEKKKRGRKPKIIEQPIIKDMKNPFAKNLDMINPFSKGKTPAQTPNT
jgi:hypothetical protein